MSDKKVTKKRAISQKAIYLLDPDGADSCEAPLIMTAEAAEEEVVQTINMFVMETINLIVSSGEWPEEDPKFKIVSDVEDFEERTWKCPECDRPFHIHTLSAADDGRRVRTPTNFTKYLIVQTGHRIWTMNIGVVLHYMEEHRGMLDQQVITHMMRSATGQISCEKALEACSSSELLDIIHEMRRDKAAMELDRDRILSRLKDLEDALLSANRATSDNRDALDPKPTTHAADEDLGNGEYANLPELTI